MLVEKTKINNSKAGTYYHLFYKNTIEKINIFKKN